MAKLLDFEFNEPSGSITAHCKIGGARHVARFYGDAATDGDGAVWLDGARDYLQVELDGDVALSQGTIALQFTQFAPSPANSPYGYPGAHTLASLGSHGSGQRDCLAIFVDAGGQVVVVHQTGSEKTRISGGDILIGDPTSIAFSWSPDGGKLMINGTEVASHDQSLALTAKAGKIILGACESFSDGETTRGKTGFFDGEISRFELFDHPIPQSGQIPSFGAGTWIATPHGDRLVQDLTSGDQVTTHGDGVVTIRAVFHTHVPAKTMALCPSHWPVVIPKGQFGARRDLFLSRRHAVLVSDGRDNRLVRAGQLARAGPPDVRLARKHGRFSFVHLLCDGHFVVIANGVPCETLLPGPRISQWTGTLAKTEPCFAYADGQWCRRVFATQRRAQRIPA